MSLRTVADETPRLWRSTNALEPIGSWVATKSATMARSTSNRRSSALPTGGHLLRYPLNPVHFTVSGAFDLTSGARADTKAPLRRRVGVLVRLLAGMAGIRLAFPA